MGIVVTIAMLLGLVILRPTPWRGDHVRGDHIRSPNTRFALFVAGYLAAAGTWNVLWYGLRNLTSFWGLAALISGVVMIFSAVIIWFEKDDLNGDKFAWPGTIRALTVWTLAGCFLLYAVTLLQLNLGYPIIR